MVDNFDKYFPEKLFCVDIWEDALEIVLKPAPSLYLKIKCDCDYCSGCESIFIEVKASEKRGVTIKDAIKAMADAEYQPECSMITLKGFEKLSEDFIRPIFEL